MLSLCLFTFFIVLLWIFCRPNTCCHFKVISRCECVKACVYVALDYFLLTPSSTTAMPEITINQSHCTTLYNCSYWTMVQSNFYANCIFFIRLKYIRQHCFCVRRKEGDISNFLYLFFL